ncbi:deleted in malignant brain tumors 1 protein-like isoform X4 [Colossoma macropomum]|uniref:deleted in malignant brain tumors 1 protein-like isoform X4 n=1 Tax=Colossoma macropomum TaxID=42526 RepID=UPI0018648340|nr:deleted in malignant brain tumors 1 protein-like isoform X4 [Colossoma macropomum]
MGKMKLGMIILFFLVGVSPGANGWSWTETTKRPWITESPSCWWNCGYDLGSCSCSSSCQYYGDCCHDYHAYCYTTTTTGAPDTTSESPSCRWNCGYNLGSCSCSSSCQYYGNCCHDYHDYCYTTTTTTTTTGTLETTSESPSCRWNCGYNLGSCSCSSSCQYYGNCCHDYHDYCDTTTTTGAPDTTTESPSCRWNCGYNLGSCSCSSSCQYYGNCCHDYHDYCYTSPITAALDTTTGGAPCGGDLTNSRGEFFSPQYPNNYPNNANCTWRLLASERQTVNLTFMFVDLEACCDFIRVYDGPSAAYPLLGRVPQDQRYHFNSSRNYLTVVFSSDSSVTRQGFRALWEFAGGAPCGGDLTNSRGEFFSPQYPNNYPNNANCTWRLLASETQVVNLTFTFVDLEACCDFIRVYDGPSAAYPLLGRVPQDQRYHFNSSRNYLTVVFSSDSSVTRQGFRALWEFAGGAPCGGDLTNSRGEFFSPQYPNNYPNNANCTWRLLASETQVVNLTFTFVDLEACCDSIRVYDGPSAAYPLLGRVPQDQRYHFNSSRNYLTVVFSSDSSVTRPGFRALWEFAEMPYCRGNCGYSFSRCSCASSCQYYGNCCHDYYTYCSATTKRPPVTHPTCGGRLFDSGSISSPYYPNYYHDNAYCVWQLSAPAGQRIFLSFVDLELERCCNCDYIYVYDGSTTASSLLGKLCYNDTTLRDFRSSSSYMTVLFRSDGSGVARGFKASFSSSLPENTARVVCSSDSMTIVIQRSYLNSLGIGWQNLYVDDHRCRPSANSYEVSFNFPIDMCGTSKTTNNGRVVYNNHVRAAPTQSGEITRQLEQFLLSVRCHMEQDTTVGTVYKVKEMINNTISGTGRFNASMAFYPSSSFSYPILQFPYEVSLNQYLYVQVQLSRADNTLDLLLDSCVASPNHDFQARSYTLIQNGCAKDSTVYIYTNGRQYYAQFHFRAFKFLRTHSYVFLQCRVIVCADSDYNSRCRQGCRMRKKRSLDSSHHTETVTLGPITLKGAKAESAAEVEKEE